MARLTIDRGNTAEANRLWTMLILGTLGPTVAVLLWLYPLVAIYVVPPILVFMAVVAQRK